jgi:hypothetical protein
MSHFYRLLTLATPTASGVELRWQALGTYTYVYIVQYRVHSDQSDVTLTASFFQSNIYRDENWANDYAQYQATQALDVTHDWSTFHSAMGVSGSTRSVSVQDLLGDTYYDFQVQAFANNSVVSSQVVTVNTANISKSYCQSSNDHHCPRFLCSTVYEQREAQTRQASESLLVGYICRYPHRTT